MFRQSKVFVEPVKLPQYEYTVIKTYAPIRSEDWNFLNDHVYRDKDGRPGGHRTLNELASLGYRIVHIIHDSECYLYYLEREYDPNDGINRNLPPDYDHTINR